MEPRQRPSSIVESDGANRTDSTVIVRFPFEIAITTAFSEWVCSASTRSVWSAASPDTAGKLREVIFRATEHATGIRCKLDFVHFVTPAKAPESQNGQSQ